MSLLFKSMIDSFQITTQNGQKVPKSQWNFQAFHLEKETCKRHLPIILQI